MKGVIRTKHALEILSICLLAFAVMGHKGISAAAEEYYTETIQGVEWGVIVYSEHDIAIEPVEPEQLSGEITVPKEVNGYQPTCLRGFGKADQVTKVEIPDGIVEIESTAFGACSALKSVAMSNSVKYIGDYAFSDCMNLERISLSKSLQTIGDSAFLNCRKITDLSIPESTTDIGYRAFSGCVELSKIELGQNVSTLGSLAFQCCFKLESVKLPDQLKELQARTFDECIQLKTVFIGEKTSLIDFDAFLYCDNLTEINVSDSNRFYSSKDGVVFNQSKSELFYALRTITGTYEIPDETIRVGERAFYECKNLEAITGGANVLEIENKAFSYCSNLTCRSLFPKLTKTAYDAFLGCPVCKKVSIPASVTQLTEKEVEYCRDMDEIYVVDGNSSYCAIDGILYNKNQTVVILCPTGWSKTTYKTPDTVKVIAEDSFMSDYLTTVELSEGVTTVKTGAFFECPYLDTVTLPMTLTTVEAGAFYEPYRGVEDYVDPFGIRFVTYNGNETQWNAFLQSEQNQDREAFSNLEELNCVGKQEEEKDTDLTGSFSIASEWNTGCNVIFTVTNKSDHVINGWKVQFSSKDNITSIWCAVTESQVDGIYVIQNAAWNGTLQPGESASFGFITDKVGAETVIPDDIVVREVIK